MENEISKYQRSEIKRQTSEIQELKEENERLRKALSIVVTPKQDPPEAKTFAFLHLPAELREAIYELCLVKGTVYPAPRVTFDHRYNNIHLHDKPAWALLRINRQIRDEAAKVLLTKNHFVLSFDPRSHLRFWATRALLDRLPRHPNRPQNSLPQLVATHLKSASITLDIRCIATDPIQIASYAQDDVQRFAHITNVQRILDAHSEFEQCTYVWRDICTFFMQQIEYLETDLTNIYCPLGCHRYIDKAAYYFEYAIPLGIPHTLVVLGTKTKAERYQIRQAVENGLKESHKYSEHGGILRFKAASCLSGCPFLHYMFADELEDEEITFKDLMEKRRASLA